MRYEAQFWCNCSLFYGFPQIAAAHVQADSVVHFGNACQSKVTRLPVFYVFPHLEFDCDNFVNCISNLNLDNSNGSCQTIDVFFELSYQHVIGEFCFWSNLSRACFRLISNLPNIGQFQMMRTKMLC